MPRLPPLPRSASRALPALLLLTLALGAGAAHARQAPDGGPRADGTPDALLDVRVRREGLGSSYRVRSMRVKLDGAPLGVDGAPALAAGRGAEAVLYAGPVSPGVHVLTLEAVLVGRSAVFGYVEGYRLVLRGRVTFEGREGWSVDVVARLDEARDLTLGWQHRPRQALEGRPRELVREVVDEPPTLERDADPEPDTTQAEREQEAAMARELEREARAQEPPPDAGPALAAAPRPPLPCAPVTVRFDFAASAPEPGAAEALGALAACVAERFPDARLRVVGHTDVRGSDAFNLRLGEKRARAVAGLLERRGVLPGRVTTGSRGRAEPACRERTEACHARNRRTEVTVEVEVEAASPPR